MSHNYRGPINILHVSCVISFFVNVMPRFKASKLNVENTSVLRMCEVLRSTTVCEEYKLLDHGYILIRWEADSVMWVSVLVPSYKPAYGIGERWSYPLSGTTVTMGRPTSPHCSCSLMLSYKSRIGISQITTTFGIREYDLPLYKSTPVLDRTSRVLGLPINLAEMCKLRIMQVHIRKIKYVIAVLLRCDMVIDIVHIISCMLGELVRQDIKLYG